MLRYICTKQNKKHHKVVHTTCILYHDTTVCARNRLHLFIFTEMTLHRIELKNLICEKMFFRVSN